MTAEFQNLTAEFRSLTAEFQNLTSSFQNLTAEFQHLTAEFQTNGRISNFQKIKIGEKSEKSYSVRWFMGSSVRSKIAIP